LPENQSLPLVPGQKNKYFPLTTYRLVCIVRPDMKTSTTRAPKETRRRILKAAFGEFYRNGFQGGSLNRIVEGAGTTKGALFHHFEGKALAGIIGTAKNAQSEELLKQAGEGLFDYLDSLRPWNRIFYVRYNTDWSVCKRLMTSRYSHEVGGNYESRKIKLGYCRTARHLLHGHAAPRRGSG